MATFIFSSSEVLERHVRAQKVAVGAQHELLNRLGVKKARQQRITFLIISKNVFDGFGVMVELMEACEREFDKRIDTSRLRFELFPSIEEAGKNPVVEIASFIYFPDEDLHDLSEYPELLDLLPFFE